MQNDTDKLRRRQDWVDVDALNHEDPQAVSHYAPAIFEYLREAEVRGQRKGRLCADRSENTPRSFLPGMSAEHSQHLEQLQQAYIWMA